MAPVSCFSRTETLPPPGVSCLARKLTTGPPTWCSVSSASSKRDRKSLWVFPEKSACMELGVGEDSKRSRAARKPAERRKRGPVALDRGGRRLLRFSRERSRGEDLLRPRSPRPGLSEVTSSSVMTNRVLALREPRANHPVVGPQVAWPKRLWWLPDSRPPAMACPRFGWHLGRSFVFKLCPDHESHF